MPRRPVRLPLLSALRPLQWTKNLIVFAAPLFALSFTQEALISATLAFVLFCCVSSGSYLLNDVFDRQSDRLHPAKRHRPIAAGLVSVYTAVGLSVVLLVGAGVAGWLFSWKLGLTVASYALLQILYNLSLKHAPILDILTIASGFVLRAYAGAAATELTVSPWFLLCTAMLALFLGVEKRKAELRLSSSSDSPTRSVLRSYSLAFLNRIENTVTTGAVMTYALWSAGPSVHGAPTPFMLLTLPFVLYGVFRYQLISEQTRTGSGEESTGKAGITERPEEVLFRDWPILLTMCAWILASLAILFFLADHPGI